MTVGTPTSRIIGRVGVLESVPFVAPELQRRFQGDEITVKAVRLTTDLAAMPAPRVFALAFAFDEVAVINFVKSVRDEPHTACIVVVSAGRFSDAEWLLRELGADSVIEDAIRGEPLAAICRKLLKSRIQGKQIRDTHV